MTVTIQIRPGSAISLDPIRNLAIAPAVLITFEGEVHGTAINCAVIPASKIQQTIDALILVRDQAVRDVVSLS